MKKTIFEGVVNGVKFDNVKDYNTAITAAMQSGESVNASSSTKTVEEPDEDRVKKLAGMIGWLFYGLEDKAEELNESFLQDKSKFEELLKMSDDDIANLANEKLQEAMKLMNLSDRVAYVADVIKVLNYFNELYIERTNRKEAIKKQIDAYKKRIDELTGNLNETQKDFEVLKKLTTYYAAVVDFMADSEDEPETTQPQAESEASEEGKPTNHDVALKNLLKLCAEIFPDYKLS